MHVPVPACQAKNAHMPGSRQSLTATFKHRAQHWHRVEEDYIGICRIHDLHTNIDKPIGNRMVNLAHEDNKIR